MFKAKKDPAQAILLFELSAFKSNSRASLYQRLWCALNGKQLTLGLAVCLSSHEMNLYNQC